MKNLWNGFILRGQRLRVQCTYWQNMIFDHNKHDVEQFTYELGVLGKIMGLSDERVLENFKEAFPSKIEAHILKKDDIDTAIGKARGLVLLFKSELPQSMSSSVLAHIKEMMTLVV